MASHILGIIGRLRKIENVRSGVMWAQSSCEMPKTNIQVCVTIGPPDTCSMPGEKMEFRKL